MASPSCENCRASHPKENCLSMDFLKEHVNFIQNVSHNLYGQTYNPEGDNIWTSDLQKIFNQYIQKIDKIF